MILLLFTLDVSVTVAVKTIKIMQACVRGSVFAGAGARMCVCVCVCVCV